MEENQAPPQEQQPQQDFFQADEVIESVNNQQPAGDESISWSASEFMYHHKSISWYMSALLVVVLATGLAYLFMKELFGPIAVFVLGTLLMLGASKKPRTMNYTVDHQGVAVGNKEYTYEDFTSFAIIQEDSMESIMLIPQKRWSQALSLYFDPADGQKIVDIISSYLPIENREKDRVDKFLHRIRF